MEKKNKIKDINEYKKQKKNKHKKRVSKKIRNKLLKIFMPIAIFFIIIVNICGYAILSDLKYDIHYLEQDLRKEEVKLEQLKASSTTKMSIQEIEKKAKEELNMNYPTKNQIRYVEVKK